MKEEQSKQYISFYVGKRMYGINIKLINEVNDIEKLTPVPRSARHIRGLVNIRGDVILVLDIATILDHGETALTEKSKVIVLNTQQRLLQMRELAREISTDIFSNRPTGILVDRIGEAITINSKEIEPPPPNINEKNAAYFEGVAKLKDNLLIILNVAELL